MNFLLYSIPLVLLSAMLILITRMIDKLSKDLKSLLSGHADNRVDFGWVKRHQHETNEMVKKIQRKMDRLEQRIIKLAKLR